MADTKALLGALLGRGMTDSSSQRLQHSLSEEGGLGGILESLGLAPGKQQTVGAESGAKHASAGNPLDALAGMAKSIFGEGEQGSGGAVAAGGLGALLGSILGGGGKSAKGALGGGALALLGAIALRALRGSQQPLRPDDLNTSERLAAGLREASTPQEEQQVAALADLTVKAMINAAKADGRIDEDEMQKVIGELQADGISDAERAYVMAEIRKPLNTAELVRAVPNQQVAAQIYAASLLAIEVDTPAEKAYLEGLARDMNLDPRVVRQIHSTLGVA
jgi:uncharacterized membrane protein YebE (DUF533 family)